MTPRGFEPQQDSLEKLGVCQPSGANSGALLPDPSAIDNDLARLIVVWPTLADPVRRAILALIEAAGGQLIELDAEKRVVEGPSRREGPTG
jgi:hypothetical protein